jgi:hypothetical protein
MEEIISKKEFDRLIKFNVEVRGNGLKNIANFILREKGEAGLREVSDAINQLGYKLNYNTVRGMDFYPIGLVPISLLVTQKLFNFGNKEFQQMGELDAKFTSLTRIFIKYFVSLDKAVKAAPTMWRTYNTAGDLRVTEYNKEKKYIILRIENFVLHPFHCQYLIGYFRGVIQMITGIKAVCQETKCVHRGDEYNEFLMKW